jgi:VWFA-related protein
MSGCVSALAVVFSASAMLGSSSAFAQPAAQNSSPVFKTAARLVRINVTVTDSQGKPVTDLRASDFQIRDSGISRKVSLFRFDGSRAESQAPRPLPPGVFSNRVQFAGGSPRNVTALLVDALNTSILDNSFVREEAAKYLRSVSASDTRFAVYLLADGVSTVADFADSPDVVRSRLEAMTARIPPIIRFREDRIRLTLDALDAVGRHLERFDGRKSIVWVTGGFSALTLTPVRGPGGTGGGPQVSIDAVEADARRTAQSLAQRGVTLYIEDARGLRSGREGVPAQSTPAGRGLFGALRAASELNNGFIGTMTRLAEITGGRYRFNTNDMTAAFRNSLDDLAASYTLGFYSDADDEKWHPLEIRVNRRGLTVRNRQGWIAESARPADASTAAAWQRAIDEPLESSAIRLNARCIPVPQAADTLELILQIDSETVVFEHRDRTSVADLDVMIVHRTIDGGFRQLTQHMTVEWDDEQLAAGRANGIVYLRRWMPPTDVAAIRVIVRDSRTGQYGTLDMPMAKVRAAAGVFAAPAVAKK